MRCLRRVLSARGSFHRVLKPSYVLPYRLRKRGALDHDSVRLNMVGCSITRWMGEDAEPLMW